MNKRKIGSLAEEKVAEYLKNYGYVIQERNYRVPNAEIDIIATKNNTINFIEVKKIPCGWDGMDVSAKVNMQKKSKIRFSASCYLAQSSEIKYDKISFDIALVTGDDVQIYYGAF